MTDKEKRTITEQSAADESMRAADVNGCDGADTADYLPNIPFPLRLSIKSTALPAPAATQSIGFSAI